MTLFLFYVSVRTAPPLFPGASLDDWRGSRDRVAEVVRDLVNVIVPGLTCTPGAFHYPPMTKVGLPLRPYLTPSEP